ncbi:unnamed protein product [Gongylonema pulchrum]|uniref:Homeobox domain-containing protein n=1 Tax=Gongylonema pulchrum TaxID=637853 RepID=A0A183EXF8_9BILA|nr:unnamed protein product [Gongylonema pulchrum]
MSDGKSCTAGLDVFDDEDRTYWFYGEHDTSEQKQRKSERKIRKQQEKVFESLFEASLGPFNVYKRQSEALERCEKEGPAARIFPFEISPKSPGWYLLDQLLFNRMLNITLVTLLTDGCFLFSRSSVQDHSN